MLVAASLRTPEGWREQLIADNLEGLRLELQAGRKLPPIQVVETEDGRHEVVKGFHRLAAHLDEGIEDIRADVVEYASPEERDIDVLAENLRRRHLPPAERAAGLQRLVARFEASPADSAYILEQLDAEQGQGVLEAAAEGFSSDDQQPPKAPKVDKGGRPKSPKRQAIKKAAKVTGLSEATVERAVSPPKPQADEDPTTAPAPVAYYLDWFDTPPIGAVDAKARRVQVQVEDIDKDLRAARKKITGLRELGHPNALCDAIEAAYTTLAHLVRRSRPSTVCHACKGQPGANCFDCQGSQYSTIHQAEGDVPKELLERGDRAMVRNGRGGFRALAAEPEAKEEGEADETPDGDPSMPFEPTPGQSVLVKRWQTGEPQLARFNRWTDKDRMSVSLAGSGEGDWKRAISMMRKDLIGPAPAADEPF